MEHQEEGKLSPAESPLPGRSPCVVLEKERQRWIIFTTCFATFMCVLDSFIVNISLPVIAHDFNASTGAVARVVIVYLLVLTSTIPAFGKLGDRLGLTRVFTAGFLIFTLGSLLCGLSLSITMLILARVVQALGGAILFALPAAIVARFLPQDMRGVTFGTLATAAALGLSLGAPLGGLITTHFSWHFIFLLNLPVGIAAAFLVRRYFPRDERSAAPRPFDLPGVFLSFFGIGALLFCFNNGAVRGWTAAPIVIAFGLSLALLVLFLLRESRCSDPLVNLSIFRHRDYVLANTANFFQSMILAGNGFLLPFYLIQVKGLRPDRAGLVIMTYSIVLMILSPLVGKASDRIPPRLLCCAGALLAIPALFFFSQTLGQEGLWHIFLFLVWLAVSFVLFVPPNNNLIMSSIPHEEQGTASALLKTITNMGQAFGVCFFEIIFALNIPGHQIKVEGSLSQSGLSSAALVQGLHLAYFCASLITVATLVCMLLVSDTSKTQKKRDF